MLFRAGYRVLEAANAGEALLIVEDREEPLRLLLTDVVMPRVSGPKLAKRLVQLHPEMKVLLMTGHPRDELLEGREWPVVQKPFSPATLLEAVRSVLEGARA